MDKLITTAEAAKHMKRSEGYVRRLLREGRLRGVKHGRDYLIKESDAKGWKAERKPGRPKTT